MKQVKKLDLTKRTFTANGNQYTILDAIPLSRYIAYQKLVPRLTFGVTFPQMFASVKQAYELQNTGKRYADVAVILHNIMNSIKDLETDDRTEAALAICTLVVVTDNEDVGEPVSEALSKQKINDWSKEGYETNGFFHLALIFIEGFRTTLLEYIKESQ